jgi:hypothetical protein
MSMSARPIIYGSLLALAVAACGSSSSSPDGTGGSSAGTGGATTGGSSGTTGGDGSTGTGGSGGGTSAGAFLDDCFTGLRKLADRSQTSDRTCKNASGDGCGSGGLCK